MAPPRITTNNVDISAHLPYIRDKLVEQENELSQLIETEQYEISTLRHSQSLATAQYNRWLAAYQLGFPNCTKLSVAVQTARHRLYTDRNYFRNRSNLLRTTATIPKPDHQSRWMGADPVLSVLLRMGSVNFNKKPHAYRNGSWIPIEASIVVPDIK